VSKAAADSAHINYILQDELASFHKLIAMRNHEKCSWALAALGHLTHTWEDFYSHAIRNVAEIPGVGKPSVAINRDVVWGDGAPPLVIGDADRPGPDVVAPTFSYARFGGQHGASEPSSRDLPNGLDRRRAAAVDFVAGKLKTLLEEWFDKCC
jgi:hypothetical protein